MHLRRLIERMKSLLLLPALLFLTVTAIAADDPDGFLARDLVISDDSGFTRYRIGTPVVKHSVGRYTMPDKRVVIIPADALSETPVAVPAAAPAVPAKVTAPPTPKPAPKATPRPAARSTPSAYRNPLGTPRLDMKRKR